MNQNSHQHETMVDTLSKEESSTLKRYQDLFVGKSGFVSLMAYEFFTSFLSPVPGAIGFLLRKIFAKRIFAEIGRGTILGPNLTLRSPARISLGSNVFIDDNVTLDAKGLNSRVKIGDSILIGKNSIFSCASATIDLGNDVSLGPNCYIRASRGPVRLGSCITIGANTVIISGNPDYRRLDIPMMKQESQAEGIVIGDDVWLGVGVRVIDGVAIGNGCVIGAGAVVTKAIPDYSIAAGVPARVLKSRK